MHRFKKEKRTDIAVRFAFFTSAVTFTQHEDLVRKLFDLFIHACDKTGLRGIPDIFTLKKHVASPGDQVDAMCVVVCLNEGGLPMVAELNRYYPAVVVTEHAERLQRFCQGGRTLIMVRPDDVVSNLRSFKKLMTKLLKDEGHWVEPVAAAI